MERRMRNHKNSGPTNGHRSTAGEDFVPEILDTRLRTRSNASISTVVDEEDDKSFVKRMTNYHRVEKDFVVVRVEQDGISTVLDFTGARNNHRFQKSFGEHRAEMSCYQVGDILKIPWVPFGYKKEEWYEAGVILVTKSVAEAYKMRDDLNQQAEQERSERGESGNDSDTEELEAAVFGKSNTNTKRSSRAKTRDDIKKGAQKKPPPSSGTVPHAAKTGQQKPTPEVVKLRKRQSETLPAKHPSGTGSSRIKPPNSSSGIQIKPGSQPVHNFSRDSTPRPSRSESPQTTISQSGGVNRNNNTGTDSTGNSDSDEQEITSRVLARRKRNRILSDSASPTPTATRPTDMKNQAVMTDKQRVAPKRPRKSILGRREPVNDVTEHSTGTASDAEGPHMTKSPEDTTIGSHLRRPETKNRPAQIRHRQDRKSLRAKIKAIDERPSMRKRLFLKHYWQNKPKDKSKRADVKELFKGRRCWIYRTVLKQLEDDRGPSSGTDQRSVFDFANELFLHMCGGEAAIIDLKRRFKDVASVSLLSSEDAAPAIIGYVNQLFGLDGARKLRRDSTLRRFNAKAQTLFENAVESDAIRAKTMKAKRLRLQKSSSESSAASEDDEPRIDS